ncbi:hypothetical protein FPE49_000564 [Salmonella bongori]|nr:hypothetical protein [Salmonella bongori]
MSPVNVTWSVENLDHSGEKNLQSVIAPEVIIAAQISVICHIPGIQRTTSRIITRHSG